MSKQVAFLYEQLILASIEVRTYWMPNIKATQSVSQHLLSHVFARIDAHVLASWSVRTLWASAGSASFNL